MNKINSGQVNPRLASMTAPAPLQDARCIQGDSYSTVSIGGQRPGGSTGPTLAPAVFQGLISPESLRSIKQTINGLENDVRKKKDTQLALHRRVDRLKADYKEFMSHKDMVMAKFTKDEFIICRKKLDECEQGYYCDQAQLERMENMVKGAETEEARQKRNHHEKILTEAWTTLKINAQVEDYDLNVKRQNSRLVNNMHAAEEDDIAEVTQKAAYDAELEDETAKDMIADAEQQLPQEWEKCSLSERLSDAGSSLWEVPAQPLAAAPELTRAQEFVLTE